MFSCSFKFLCQRVDGRLVHELFMCAMFLNVKIHTFLVIKLTPAYKL